METCVQIKNISKVIKGKKIIDSLTFDIQKGEVFGFLGPNGAGKTTTIRMIVGLMGMTEGDITICGYSIRKDFEKAVRQIGAIVENPEMYKFLSGYENLKQFARMNGNISKKKIDEVVKLVGLTERIHDKVKTYSLGMRQRLGLAQSLLHDPQVLILDEPTNGLDPAGIREIRDHIRMLAEKKGMAVIVSSHLLSEMEMMCDRIGIIQNGKLIDVQMVNEFVNGNEETYSFEVDDIHVAAKALKQSFSQFHEKIVDQHLVVECSKQYIPDILSLFIQEGVRVYEVKSVTKSLEDRFLEITDKERGLVHV
ncbi:ABC-2 type transport system ATP-binding protein [Oikeobacillus pervagus]|uniref:ABC-2 type transport system ATP-binding protein n=1 Tax=Oikeobacillus pervagus TaxID=1325931 RepID=A0AAJ1WIR6_9BACI|nr:ABC transporter ATP-binding protein [Oikeobacillus pervagus]MDQ0214603.1 ABC-2 type transport system ATP-binding protein [Oikeobacillus pervagus]